jgi:2-methylcitrate dehydratase PrpD
MSSVSDILCQHAASMTWDRLPVTARDAARRVFLDATGVMFAASGLAPEAQPFISLARANGNGPCSILGTEAKVQPLGAALGNGALAHAVDYEDAFDKAPGHPNASLVPVLLALAQSVPVNGKAFLTALAVGGDVACRIALALRKPMEDGKWYPPPIVAAYGAVAGAANLLKLTPAQTKDALSMVLCQVTMPGEIKYSQRTVLRAVREAFPAQAALSAVLLAREGVAGFEAPLEGQAGFYALYAGGQFDAATLTDRLGAHFWTTELTFKPWPSCRGTHPFIEMALDLRSKHRLKPHDIASIEVGIDGVQAMLVEPLARKQAPSVTIDAKFSIPFTVALALKRGRVTLDDFANLKDETVLALSKLVTPRLDSNASWQRGSGGALKITTKDGTAFSAAVNNALGCPERPLSDQALTAKFVDCASRAHVPMKREHAEKLADVIMSLEMCTDVGALF